MKFLSNILISVSDVRTLIQYYVIYTSVATNQPSFSNIVVDICKIFFVISKIIKIQYIGTSHVRGIHWGCTGTNFLSYGRNRIRPELCIYSKYIESIESAWGISPPRNTNFPHWPLAFTPMNVCHFEYFHGECLISTVAQNKVHRRPTSWFFL